MFPTFFGFSIATLCSSAARFWRYATGKSLMPSVWLLAAAMIAAGPTFSRAADSIWITEFMARNDHGLIDDFGQFSDWIEIHNRGAAPGNLEGYYLTDDPLDLKKWRFPSAELPANGYMIIFASGANRAVAGRPLHTNFRLSSGGEYLALVQPDGTTVAQQFTPAYPAQSADVSYGVAVEELISEAFVPRAATGKFIVPASDTATAWKGVDFDDSSWRMVQTPIKYDRSTGEYDRLPGTDVESGMYSVNSSAYLRFAFNATDASKFNDFQLAMRYDDGFVAYLNGQEIARRLAPANLIWSSVATGQRSNSVSLVAERVNLLTKTNLLVSGRNVLAVHGLNRSGADPDFLIWPELVGRLVKIVPGVQRFLEAPTPGAANAGGVLGSAGEVRFSRKSTTYTSPFDLQIEPKEPLPGAVVRYTLNRTLPTEASTVYSAPISIRTTVQVRAQVFAPGYFPGPVRTETFVQIGPTALNFTSDLPIIIIHTLGAGTIGGVTDRPSFISIHEPIRGRSSLTNPPQLTTRAGLKTRGSSTGSQAKSNFAVELWGEQDVNDAKPILGMPADADWVFHAPFNWDPSLIRNPLAFEMSQRLGRYAPRYRFAEVYLNATGAGGPVTSTNYFGVYNLMEKIKRGKNRVDIDELLPTDLQPPEITGGYILKIDRTDPADTGFTAGGRTIAYVEPKEGEIKSAVRDPQEKYLAGYLNAFNAALNSAAFADPIRGYAPYVDAGSWIDHHIVDTITFNVDALRLSSFFRKVRNGPLVYGPVWDYDRSMESTDDRDNQPRIWGGDFFTMTWWNRLFRDPNFWQQWIDRWQTQREGILSDRALLNLVDSLGAQVAESAPRDFTRWRQPKRGRSQEGELNNLKNWLFARTEFMDSNLVAKPVFSHSGGQLSPGFMLAMAGPPNATVYYTLDGKDPRLSGGQLSPGALVYSGPIRLDRGALVRARARNLAHRHASGPPVTSPWSGMTEARFSERDPAVFGQLVVTELHFNPTAPTPAERALDPAFGNDDFEFLELKNISAGTIDLFDAHFTSGIEFAFSGSGFETIAPGQTILLVENKAAFKARYGDRANIAGQYSGNLDNRGERLHLVNGRGESILDFSYEADWYPITDGLGFSLVLRNDAANPNFSSKKTEWRASAQLGGSPSAADPQPVSLPVVLVNEALPWSNRKDAIELFNPGTSSADIGGWYLTDDRQSPRKFQIPPGTVIPPGGFWVIDEDQFDGSNGRGFALNRTGEGVYLISADTAGNLQWHMHGFSYSAAERETSFGRHVTSTGQEHFVAQSSTSLNGPNTGPKVGPVVIDEIMYHPPDLIVAGQAFDIDEDEFIELRNITNEPVPLFDVNYPTNTWRIRSAIQFTFPTNTILAPQESVVIVSFDPAGQPAQLSAFRARYALGENARVLGPFSGKLDNSSDILKLRKPSEPAQNGDVPFVIADAVNYNDSAPWPAAADGIGYSLQRLDSRAYGSDSVNWAAANPTPGRANQFGTPPRILQQPQSQTAVSGSTVVLSVTATDSSRYQWRFQNRNLLGQTNATLTLANITTASAGEYSAIVIGANGALASSPALLAVQRGPEFVLQPLSRRVNPGTNVTFAVSVRATEPVRFQWRFNGTPISGATESSLKLQNVQLDQIGSYTVEVYDAVGAAISEPAVLTVLMRPTILTHPASQIAFVGDTVTFGVTAIGTPPLTYRWRRNGGLLSSETNATLTLRNVRVEDTASYSVLILNLASGTAGVLSSEASLAVFVDSDGDRIADLWENANGLSPTDPKDASLDSDGDGVSNLLEFAADTNPRDPASFFKLGPIRWTVQGAHLEFEGRTNRTYTLQFRDELTRGPWNTLTNFPGRFDNRIEQFLDPSTQPNRFYRIVIPTP